MSRRFSLAAPSRNVTFDRETPTIRRYSVSSNIPSTLALAPETMEEIILRSASESDQVSYKALQLLLSQSICLSVITNKSIVIEGLVILYFLVSLGLQRSLCHLLSGISCCMFSLTANKAKIISLRRKNVPFYSSLRWCL